MLTDERIEHMLADAARLKSLAAEYGGVLSCGYVLDCADHIEALVAEIRRMAPERKST